ncbi:hypothetical protein [Lentzea sp. NPDC004782]|uniref:hypothetical protein n=1 Tax=Lentzea sp. NPDC004782 TaxID=3154458 RepID=UPI0033B5F8D6
MTHLDQQRERGALVSSGKQFKGLGRAIVEQWNTEQSGVLNESERFPVGDNVDAAPHVPPVQPT